MVTNGCSLGEIARQLNVPPHRVAYAILAESIKPAGRVGRYRVFTPEAVEMIRARLAARDHQAAAV